MPQRILLYPGGFKPFHDGHLLLLLDAIKNNNIDVVYIIISNYNRDNVTCISVCTHILYNIKRRIEQLYNIPVFIEMIQFGSPIQYCYKLINNDNTNDIYTILCSNKSKLDELRNDKFYEEYKVNGKYNNGKWEYDKVFKLNISELRTTKFKNRCDDHDNTPISASVLRYDIFNNDWERFMTGYRYMLLDRYIILYDLVDFWNDVARI